MSAQVHSIQPEAVAQSQDRCPHCGGAGERAFYIHNWRKGESQFSHNARCEECHGTGRTIHVVPLDGPELSDEELERLNLSLDLAACFDRGEDVAVPGHWEREAAKTLEELNALDEVIRKNLIRHSPTPRPGYITSDDLAPLQRQRQRIFERYAHCDYRHAVESGLAA